MGMGFAPTWLRRVRPPLLHKTTLTTGYGTCSQRISMFTCTPTWRRSIPHRPRIKYVT